MKEPKFVGCNTSTSIEVDEWSDMKCHSLENKLTHVYFASE
jgi:hypothetical protein